MLINVTAKCFDDYRVKTVPDTFKKRLNECDFHRKSQTIACGNCDGTGYAYDPRDNDCIERYKLADKKVCLECSGKGETVCTGSY